LENIQEFFQETMKENPSSIATTKSNTIAKTVVVRSPSLEISQEHFGDFENHTKGIGSKLLRQMG
jgi:hypothetical protein